MPGLFVFRGQQKIGLTIDKRVVSRTGIGVGTEISNVLFFRK
jgi:hypothetical protein